MRHALATAALACLAACTTVPPPASPPVHAAPASRAGPGLRASPPRTASPLVVPLGGDALARAPVVDVQVAFGGRRLACRAVAVADLLRHAGLWPAMTPDVARYVLATARDGRRVLFSLGELDPQAGGRRVLVTRDCDDGGAGTVRMRVLLALDDATPARRLDGVDALVVVAAP